MRLFLAIALSPEVRETIARQTELLRGQLPDQRLRWVETENLHLTMLFFGEIEDERLDELRGTILQAVAELKPMHLQYGGLGSFPFRRPRVIWVGTLSEPPEILSSFMAHLKEACSDFTSEPWRNSYPHVTVARVQHKAGDPKTLESAIRAFRWSEIVSQDVGELTLYRSRLTREGPRYEVVHEFPLGSDV